MSSACTTIVYKLVIWICEIETGWINIYIEQTVGHSCKDGQIVLESVVHLNTILQEEG